MSYRDRNSGGYPVSEYAIRAAHPDVSFPADITPGDVAAFGFDFVTSATEPAAPAGMQYTEGPPAQQPDGSWQQSWIESPVAPPVVPDQVTRWQAMQVMLTTPSQNNPSPATVFSDVQALVVATGGAMQLAWQNQQFVYRHGAFMATVSAACNLTGDLLDAMFIAAAALPP